MGTTSWSGRRGGNGPSWEQALTECGIDPEGEYPAPEVQEDGSGKPIACGSDTCAQVDCGDYDYAVSEASNTTNSSLKRIYASIPLTQAQVLESSPTAMFCSNGRYIWSSTATRSRFNGLGTGDIYYTLGLRNGDRVLSMSRFNPSNLQQVGSTYTVNTPTDLVDAYEALTTSGSATYVAIKIRRGRDDWTVYVSAD